MFSKRLFLVTAVFALAVVSGVAIKHSFAGTSQSGAGWLWGGMDAAGGGNTALGWISMNSTEPASAVDYGVNIPSANGDLSGYSWSEHYGWVSFNAADVAGCPAGVCSARRSGNNLVGWARILSIRDAGANSGGWSGYVSLDSSTTGSLMPYGVMVLGNTLFGYAWSDELGWIDFSGASIQAVKGLQICQNSCISTFYRNGQTVSMADTDPAANYVACYADASKQCADPAATDVTGSTAWVETGPGDAVTLGGTNPKTVDPNALALPGTVSEGISATYNGITQSFTVNVSKFCASNCAAGAADHCKGETYTATNSCGLAETCTDAGTRYCDFNWKEVAPGRQ